MSMLATRRLGVAATSGRCRPTSSISAPASPCSRSVTSLCSQTICVAVASSRFASTRGGLTVPTQPSMSHASITAPWARARRICCSATGMPGGIVINRLRRCRGLSASRRCARVPGAFIWLSACSRISVSMKVNTLLRLNRARTAGLPRRCRSTLPSSATSAMNGPLTGGSVVTLGALLRSTPSLARPLNRQPWVAGRVSHK